MPNPISGIDPPFTSLNAVTTTGIGGVMIMSAPHNNVSMQVVSTGSPTAVKANLEGSIDGINFTPLAVFDTGAGATNLAIASSTSTMVLYARANLLTLTGGTTPTVTARILAGNY